MSERGGSVGKGHKFRVCGTQETGRRKRDAGNGTQETGEGAGANEVNGVLSEASRCGAPIIKKEEADTF